MFEYGLAITNITVVIVIVPHTWALNPTPSILTLNPFTFSFLVEVED